MNEVYNVVGYRPYSFKPEGSDITYHGTYLYLVSDDRTKGNMVGCLALKEKIRESVDYDPHIGDRIKLYYDKYGKVDSVALI